MPLPIPLPLPTLDRLCCTHFQTTDTSNPHINSATPPHILLTTHAPFHSFRRYYTSSHHPFMSTLNISAQRLSTPHTISSSSNTSTSHHDTHFSRTVHSSAPRISNSHSSSTLIIHHDLKSILAANLVLPTATSLPLHTLPSYTFLPSIPLLTLSHTRVLR